MKNTLKITIILLLSFLLFSCENDYNKTDPKIVQPDYIHFLINKNSNLYKDLENAFLMENYSDSPIEKRRHNNVYFQKGDIKRKLKGFTKPSPSIVHGGYMEGLYVNKTIYNYGYIFDDAVVDFYTNIFTGRDEEFYLVYGGKKIKIKVKSYHPIKNKYGSLKDLVKEFSINGKANKFVNEDSFNITLFLEE